MFSSFASRRAMGKEEKKNKEWFDENNHEIQKLLAEKRSAKHVHRAQASCPLKKARNLGNWRTSTQ